MGTTKIKIIDLSSENQSVKSSQKHAQSLDSANKIKREKPEHSAKSEKTDSQNVVSDSPSAVASVHTEQMRSEAKQSDPNVIASPQAPRNDTKKKPKTPKAQKHHLGKKYLESLVKVEKDKLYPAAEALDLLAKTSYTKFDPTVEVHISVSAKTMRGTVNYPHSVGPKKEKKYLVFTDKKDDSLKNVIWASAEDIEQIQSGKLKPGRDFNVVIASPKFMPQLASVAKVLGPVGMMPNPKSGTVTENPKTVIEAGVTSGVEFRTDPQAPIIHTKIGKLSQKPENLKENLKALITAVGPTKIKKATVTSTMGPGIKLDISSL